MLEIPEKKISYKGLLASTSVIVGIAVFAWIALQAVKQFTHQPASNVLIASVIRGDISAQIKGFGRLAMRDSHVHIARVDGIIANIHAFPGEHLTKGQTILTLSNPTLERERDLAKLELMKAKAEYEASTTQLLREQMTLENNVASTQSAIKFASKEYETLSALMEKNIVSQLEYLKAETNLEKARQDHALAKRELQAFLHSIESRKSAAQYLVDAANAKVALTQSDLDSLTVKAGSDGVLNEFSDTFRRGTPVNNGQVLFEISDPRDIYASLLINASDAEFVTPGQAVEITLRQQQYAGRVTRILPKVEDNQVVVEVDLSAPLIADNINNIEVAGTITTAISRDTAKLRTPVSVGKRDTHLVLYVKEGDAFYRRTVRVGLKNAEEVEILDSLRIGQQVAFNLPEHLKDASKFMESDISNE